MKLLFSSKDIMDRGRTLLSTARERFVDGFKELEKPEVAFILADI